MQSNLGLREKSKERGGWVNAAELLTEHGFLGVSWMQFWCLMVNGEVKKISLLGYICI